MRRSAGSRALLFFFVGCFLLLRSADLGDDLAGVFLRRFGVGI